VCKGISKGNPIRQGKISLAIRLRKDYTTPVVVRIYPLCRCDSHLRRFPRVGARGNCHCILFSVFIITQKIYYSILNIE